MQRLQRVLQKVNVLEQWQLAQLLSTQLLLARGPDQLVLVPANAT